LPERIHHEGDSVSRINRKMIGDAGDERGGKCALSVLRVINQFIRKEYKLDRDESVASPDVES